MQNQTSGDDVTGFISTNYNVRLRPFQERALMSLMKKEDIFVAVPTGTGKTFCYAFLPICCHRFYQQVDPLLLVVSPLTALIEDQIGQLAKIGVRSTYIKSALTSLNGDYEIVYISPELAQDKKLRRLVHSLQARLVGVVVDEAHCIPDWGKEFRPDYSKLGALRAIVPQTPFMALTATATVTIREKIVTSLCMTNPTTLHILPDRPNIMYQLEALNGDLLSNLSIADPIIESVNNLSNECPKVLIYCSTIDVASCVYAYFHARVPNPSTRLSPIAMFHKKTSKVNKAHVLSEFPKPNSIIRVVICTIAFGLGVNIPDISHVINIGVPTSLEDFVQESGRAGRDGRSAVSTLYHIKCLKRPDTDAAMLKYCSQDISCRRKYLAQHFKLTDYLLFAAPEVKPAPKCCDLCNPA